MEILLSVTAKIAEYTVKPIVRQLGYVYYYNNNISDLSDEVKKLKQTRDSLQHRVDEAERNAQVTEEVVKEWFNEADRIINSFEDLIPVNEVQENKKYCSTGLCFNLVQRHRESRKAKKMTVEVSKIKTNGNFESVAHQLPLSNVKLEVSGFMSFGSRESIITEIMDSLMDDNVNMIGVYGMGGTGKTMLAKEIIRRVMENESFDEAAISTVSQTHDFKRIQGELGDILGLKFEQETVEGRARKLHMRLKNEKKILIVLDDIWKDIDLDQIGIPIEDNKGCKILFTSRDKNILSSMGTNFVIEVKDLEKEESWNLFKEMAGEIVEQSDLKPIAVDIVKECAHLPIAIATIARALKSKDLPIWKDAFNQLKDPKVMNIKGMNDKVYTSLKLSYEHLDSREAKLVFLLCSMFPEDHHINVEGLLVYAMGMGLLMNIDTLKKGRYRTIKVVDDLISSSLLQKIEYGNGYVKMHDIVRDVAILIASENDKIRTLSYVHGLNEWHEEKNLGNYTAAYLDFRNSPNPPQKLILPGIQLLMFTGPYGDKPEFSGTFSEEMKDLKVLELERMRISLSPPSLHSFANLRSLRLLGCELKDVDMSSVELNKLEILSFKGSNIIEVPKVISQSKDLKVLDLSSCNKLKVIPPDLLSNLTKLEELFLGSFEGWEEESLNGERKNTSLCEIKHLSRLSALSIHIPNEKIMPKNLISSELNLEKFDISIGGDNSSFFLNHFRRLNLHMESENPLDDWIKMLLKRVEDLCLEGHTIEKFLHFEYEFDEIHFSHLKNLQFENMTKVNHVIRESKKAFWKIFPNLERVEIKDCMMLEVVFVFDIEEATNKLELIHLKSLSLKRLPDLISFSSKIEKLNNSKKVGTLFNNQVSLPNLETLYIHYVDNLKRICDRVLIPGPSFAKLKMLNIVGCDNLEIVFPSNIMSILNCLEDLTIRDCKSIEGIFEVEEPNATEQCDGLLPRLSCLRLSRLPNLKYVWREDLHELQIFENIESFYIKECPKLYIFENIENQIFEFLKLDELEMEYGELMETLEKVEIVETHSHQGEKLLPELKSLKLWGSLNYKWTHFPIQMVRIFLNLRDFEVREIFVDEIFPDCPNAKSHPLKKLTLSKLPKLMHLWSESSQMNTSLMLQELEYLTVQECDRLNSLLPSSVFSLRNLRELIIHKCNGLTHLLNPQLAATLVRLRSMELSGCKMMTSVISQGSIDEEEEIVFTELKRLELDDLPRLTSFHSGKCIIGFPCLNHVQIENCTEMKVFSLGTATTPCLKKTEIVYWSSGFEQEYFIPEEIIVEDINTIVGEAWENTNYDIQHWYTGQVLLPYYYSETLKFKFAYGFWKMICPNEILGCSLAKIKRIEITQCNNLEKVFPSNVMSSLECLKHIKIKSCRLLEGIFEEQDSNMERDEKYNGLLPQLISLELMNLPNLKYVWREDPQELQNFENMKKIYIHQCPKFKRVFPYQQLESLGIEYGELIEALNDPCESSEKIQIVELRDGPNLLHKLEDLKLSGSILNYNWTHFPMEVARILHTLKVLEVRELFVEEIFPNCPNAQSHPLKWLEIYKLPKLKYLWKENSQMNTSLMLPNLECMGIEECGRLNSMVPSSVSSLRNLRYLIIHKCHGLSDLLNPRMATTLVQLQYMRLSHCKMMTTVIAQGSGVEEEIVFPELEYLGIVDLPRLASFHSGKCIVRFPCLERVEILKCPEMKVFSKGMTTTPCLEKSVLWWSDLEEEEEEDDKIPEDSKDVMVEDMNVIIRHAWENIYDSSIQHLFTENDSLPDLDYTPQYTPSGFKLRKSWR